MMIETITLHCYVAVAETGSFTKAAEKIGRTQSAISQQIAKLEDLLQKELISRGNRLSLTPDGEIFLGYARRIISLHREVWDRFQEPELEGEVRFGLPEDFASVFLSEVLANFKNVHPRIMLNIECDLTLNLFKRFKKKEYDLVLVKMNRPDDFPNGHEVWSEPLEWVGNSEVVDCQQNVPLVLSPEPCVYRTQAIHSLEKAGKKWRLVFSSPSFASTIAAVKAGMGVTVLPRTMIPKELIPIETSMLAELSDIHVSLLKHKPNNPVINSFENFVLRKLRF